MRKILIVAAALGLALPIAGASQSFAQGAERLNQLIQSLEPAGAGARKGPAYTRRIEEIEIPVVGESGSPVQNRYILNYNHTVDLEIFFAFNSAEITPRAAEELDLLGDALTSPELAGFIYLLAGHTDAKGAASYNQSLSERRALAAKRYLLENYPIRSNRLVAVGFGESRLRDDSAPNSAVNRRVEVTLIETDYAPEVSVVVPDTTVDADGNIVCETSPVALDDPRPPRNGLDDFGGRRTPVDCEVYHNQQAPEEAVAEENPGPGDVNDVIRN